MVGKWNNGVKLVKIATMYVLFHHFPTLQHSITPLFCKDKKGLKQQKHRNLNTLLYLIEEM